MAPAQPLPDLDNLSVVSNGLAVYASTNLSLRSEPESSHEKIVKWDVDHWVTALRDWGAGYSYRRLQEDASGRVQIYTAAFPCNKPGQICLTASAGAVYWRDRDTGIQRQLGYGVGSPSDNGEWAVTASDVPTTVGPELRRIRLLDGRIEFAIDATGLTKRPVRRLIADTGLVAFASGGWLRVWKPDNTEPERSVLPRPFESYVINPKGEFLLGVGEDAPADGRQTQWNTLYRMDLVTGKFEPLAYSENGIGQPDLASDGSTAVFLSAADWEGRNPKSVIQVWLLDLRTGMKTQLTDGDENIDEVALAGNGSAAFAVTDTLRVLRIDISSRRVDEITPAYPRVLARDPVTADWARGGRYWVWGGGFESAEILVGERSVEVTAHSPFDVEFRIPWDVATGTNVVRAGSTGSPFQPWDIRVSVFDAAPSFLGSSGRELTWLHEDGITWATLENPAKLGEIVTARMTGLGPVDASGSTTTAFDLALIESFSDQSGQRALRSTPLEVIQSRGTSEPGVYLVTIRLPDALQGGLLQYQGIQASLPGGRLPSWSLLPLIAE